MNYIRMYIKWAHLHFSFSFQFAQRHVPKSAGWKGEKEAGWRAETNRENGKKKCAFFFRRTTISTPSRVLLAKPRTMFWHKYAENEPDVCSVWNIKQGLLSLLAPLPRVELRGLLRIHKKWKEREGKKERKKRGGKYFLSSLTPWRY